MVFKSSPYSAIILLVVIIFGIFVTLGFLIVVGHLAIIQFIEGKELSQKAYEVMKEVLKLNMYIGLGGAVTFKNARVPLEVAKELPLDKLLLETDCPYMSPVPMRGKRNQSTYISFVAEKIAEFRKLD